MGHQENERPDGPGVAIFSISAWAVATKNVARPANATHCHSDRRFAAVDIRPRSRSSPLLIIYPSLSSEWHRAAVVVLRRGELLS